MNYTVVYKGALELTNPSPSFTTAEAAFASIPERCRLNGTDPRDYTVHCGSNPVVVLTKPPVNLIANIGPANPKQAFGDKKIALQLVPQILSIRAAHAMKEGAVKYGPFNWRDKKVELMTYVGAIQRHLAAWVDGEEIDPESTVGKHHLDGAAASLAILLDAIYGGFAIDNRPPKGPSPEQVRTPKEPA